MFVFLTILAFTLIPLFPTFPDVVANLDNIQETIYDFILFFLSEHFPVNIYIGVISLSHFLQKDYFLKIYWIMVCLTDFSKHSEQVAMYST